ncbi:diguanylate cyclase [Anaeroselena agilis]|uniref:GGDEF domain-containing protein n=1 Tax=Anaeroselena agilis TaxID=3063788 RepID=A0ABU3NVA7_9FIRM|nr:GGDEF domain-containing protein [Selenomonadales bacterium 4137-cl]
MRIANNRRRADVKRSRWRELAGRFLTMPLALLATAALVFWQRAALPAAASGMLTMASYILAAVGMALSAGFNRSRVFVVLLLLALVETVLNLPVPAGFDARLYQAAVFYCAAVLLPLNILLVSLLGEKGLVTPAGRARLAAVAAEILVAAVLIASQDRDVAAFIGRDSLALAGITALPRTAAALTVAAAIVLALKRIRRPAPVEGALLYVLPAVAAAFHFREPAALPLFFAAAAAMLTVAAIQDSYSIAYRDELTGLPSRRALQEELSRLGDRFTVAMVDVDFFKKLNDKYGHDVGDDVLRLVAAMVMEVPGGGRSFRYGGEEFVVVFPGMGLEEARPCLEEVRQRIAARAFVVRGTGAAKRVAVAVSIGAAEGGGRQGTPAEALKKADEALYRAKEQGRNRVCT